MLSDYIVKREKRKEKRKRKKAMSEGERQTPGMCALCPGTYGYKRERAYTWHYARNKRSTAEVYCNIYAWFRQNKSIRPRFSFLFSLFLISCFLFFHPPAYAPVHTACRRTSLHSQMLCSDVYSHSGTAPSQDFLIFCFTPFCFSCCFFVDLCPTVC